jgi:predicted Zn-dependent protease
MTAPLHPVRTGPPAPFGFAQRLGRNRLQRRDLLWLIGAGAATGSLSGCAVSPVDGERILVGLSEEQERQIDQQLAPHQFSGDFGAVPDAALNRYVASVGQSIHQRSHRPHMPYSYRVVGANHVNAYIFPGGACALTRGIAVELQDEAELAALLGHEVGHVAARHTAQRKGQALVVQLAAAGILAATSESDWAGLTHIATQIGASALLASYSRDNERQADSLGQEYMVRAGYPATGMTRLHQMLMRENQRQPSLLEAMFSSHPMSAERAASASQHASTRFADSLRANPQRERYMDETARLRALKPTIEACQQGETLMARRRLADSEQSFRRAVSLGRQDYPAHVLLARNLAAQQQFSDAQRFAELARSINPHEAQAHRLVGSLRLVRRDPAGAFEAFERFDRLLPGDFQITFLMGVSLDADGQRQRAAEHYWRFLQRNPQGAQANHARNQLRAWGMLR